MNTDDKMSAVHPRLSGVGRVLCAVLLCTGLAACERNDGPAERAGESLDKAATDAGNAVEDACEKGKAAAGADDTRC